MKNLNALRDGYQNGNLDLEPIEFHVEPQPTEQVTDTNYLPLPSEES